jgi:hypothetical protein
VPPRRGDRALAYYLVSARNGCGDSVAGQSSSGTPAPLSIACSSQGADHDGDAVLDVDDDCPAVSNPGQDDGDGDFVGNVCDNCPSVSNPSQADADNDGIGDACE